MKARRKEFADKSTSDSNDIVDEKQEEESELQEVEGDKAIHSSRGTFHPSSMDEKTLKECVALAGLHEYSTYEEVPNNLRRRIRVSCFPPTEEEVAKFHLDRCMRIMPQDMDTGGFFVCLLKKVAPMNAEARARFEQLQKELELEEEQDDAIEDTKDEEPEPKEPKSKSTLSRTSETTSEESETS